MYVRVRRFFTSLWSRPDPVLAQAAIAGELLVARVRLGLASILLLIPLIDAFFFPDDPKVAIVGLSLTGGTFLTRQAALRFALAETGGDRRHVHLVRARRVDGDAR